MLFNDRHCPISIRCIRSKAVYESMITESPVEGLKSLQFKINLTSVVEATIHMHHSELAILLVVINNEDGLRSAELSVVSNILSKRDAVPR
ncbi:hypothetical protein N7488_000247 [Penicillium malachiteum]|nr:hypothetical protein N7488_000247 [Penicillium malachiteum]